MRNWLTTSLLCNYFSEYAWDSFFFSLNNFSINWAALSAHVNLFSETSVHTLRAYSKIKFIYKKHTQTFSYRKRFCTRSGTRDIRFSRDSVIFVSKMENDHSFHSDRSFSIAPMHIVVSLIAFLWDFSEIRSRPLTRIEFLSQPHYAFCMYLQSDRS